MNKEIEETGWEIIGNPDGKVHYSKEEQAVLKTMITERAKNRTPEQKRQNELIGVFSELNSYIDSPITKGEILEIGHFIKKILDIYNISNKKLSDYLGINKSNFSAIMNGSRRINFDLALKLAHIFGINANLWLAVQNKNELWRLENANKKEYEKYSLKGLLSN